MELVRLATFPFRPEASEWVKKKGPSLDDILSGTAYATARSLGKRRVAAALEKDRLWVNRYDTETEAINELLSYIVARMIASVLGDKYLIRRFVLAEAERINEKLQKEPMDYVLKVCEFLKIEVSEDLGADLESIKMHFLAFLTNTSQMRSPEWKLVNMPLKDGFVILDKRRVCRIVQEVLKRKFEEELPLAVTAGIKDAFSSEVVELQEVIEQHKKEFSPELNGVIKAECFPPCIKHLIAMAQKGENLSHMGRFTLASFLHTIGMTNEEIMKVFAVSPDFREDLARYQIEHITGGISGTEYTPPECTTMSSFGLCFEKDHLCGYEWMTHPLKYYRAKLRPPRRKGEAKKESEADKKKDGSEAAK
jgi:DNA primase large subunit